MSLNSFIANKSTFNPFVVGTTLVFLFALVGGAIFLPEQITAVLDSIKQGIFANFSWFYIISVSIFLFFLLVLAGSSLGSVKLGTNDEEPEFSFFSWLAMLFAAGMGVGLMFFGVSEPLSHSISNISGAEGQAVAREAIKYTIFHWGIHAWAIYGIISLSLAYFAFRYKLPLSLRSCLYPLFKERINGRLGDIVDIAALVATLFGIITTLGFGSAQLAAGLAENGYIESSDFGVQLIIILVVMAIAIFSAASGVGKGIKIVSEVNLILAVSLLLLVLVMGPTLLVLSNFVDNIGVYLRDLIPLSFKTYSYESENTGWFTGWTVLYWAWWVSWSPFVGLFIARISRGRTVREFIFGVLVIPTLFTILWFSVFGNTAIWLDQTVIPGELSGYISQAEALLFKFLGNFPLASLTSIIALLNITLFFVTSADSGIYVLNNMSSRDKSIVSPKWQIVMWGSLMTIISIILVDLGGLDILQTITLIVALPFTFLMMLMCASLWKGLLNDKKYFSAKVTPTSIFWTGEKWRERLGQILSQNTEGDVLRYLKTIALPGMRELALELERVHNLNVTVVEDLNDELPYVELHIHKESARDFVYGIKTVVTEVKEQLLDDSHLPYIKHSVSYQPINYFFDGRVGYDVQYMNRNELIADILKHYERYINLLTDVGSELMSHEVTELAE